MTDNIMKYAHVAEIIDRIAIEILKVHEFQYKARTSTSDEDVQKWTKKAIVAGETAEFQEQVLRERMTHKNLIPRGRELNGVPVDGKDLADVLIGAIHISVGASIVSQYENAKRQEHGKEQPNGISIAVWDGISRDACELRGNGKLFLNEAFKKVCPHYQYPTEGRTF